MKWAIEEQVNPEAQIQAKTVICLFSSKNAKSCLSALALQEFLRFYVSGIEVSPKLKM